MRITSSRELGAAVRGRRKDLGWSQGELATRAGVSRWWIGALESGKARAEVDLVLRTIESLGLILELSPPGPRPDAPPAASVPGIDLDELLRRHVLAPHPGGRA